MSNKRITINKILSNESLVQENQYFQVRAGQGANGQGAHGAGAEGSWEGCRCAQCHILQPWGFHREWPMTEGRALMSTGFHLHDLLLLIMIR